MDPHQCAGRNGIPDTKQNGAELLLTCLPEDNVFVQYTSPDGKTLASGGDDGRSVQAQTDNSDTFLINDTFSDAGGGNFEASGMQPENPIVSI